MNSYGTAALTLTRPETSSWRTTTVVPRSLADELAHGPVPLTRLGRQAAKLRELWGLGLLELHDGPLDRLVLRSGPSASEPDVRPVADTDTYKLSRFAYLRRTEAGLVWETPLAPGRLLVNDAGVLPTVAAFSEPASVAALAEGGDRDALRGLLCVLSCAGVLQRCTASGETREETEPSWRQWEFHDLLFHRRTRLGYHSEPAGAQYRWHGILPPQPALKHNPWLAGSVPLPLTDLVTAAFTDPSLCSVMEARTSGRDHDAHSPVSLAELGGFLFRCARVRGTYVNEAGQFTTRPYPSGGGSYELEVYVTVNQCAGLGRGLYYYDPALHVLSPVAGACADVEELLNDAWRSAALTCRPQILITVSSRFHRVGWKYSSISYATQLKNTGVLLQTFYLVATAMGLAGCALGLGNIERFARLTKLDPMAEGSVGEFMLGSSSAPSALRA